MRGLSQIFDPVVIPNTIYVIQANGHPPVMDQKNQAMLAVNPPLKIYHNVSVHLAPARFHPCHAAVPSPH
jgi:hypothetical protein